MSGEIYGRKKAIKKARLIGLTSLGFMLSTVPVHPWSRESRSRI